MRHHHTLSIIAAAAMVLAGCGSDETSSPTTTEPTTTDATTTTMSPATTTEQATTTSPSTTSPSTAAPTTTSPPSTSTVPAGDQTPGLWPPAGAPSPEQAVSEFVRDLLEVEANIGEFRAGDSRSGEIDVLGPEEGPGVRATAFVRQLGPDDAWFVIGAASEGVEITTPETGATVTAGPLPVDGLGRGFESTISVRALLTDADATELDSAIGAGGPFGELEPYDVLLDLSDAQPGDTVILIARGDTGLSNDPGEFTAIAVIIS